jgi:hypothetical protein
MIALQRFFVAAALIVVMPVAGSILIGSSALAANCAGSTSKCISISRDKPDAVARCTAAGESCKKTGIFVGPYTGSTGQGAGLTHGRR